GHTRPRSPRSRRARPHGAARRGRRAWRAARGRGRAAGSKPAVAIADGLVLRKARVRALSLRSLGLDSRAVTLRKLRDRADDAGVGAPTAGEARTRPVAGPDEDVLRPLGAVHIVPGPEQPLFALDDQNRLAGEHEEALLRAFAVVVARRLARLEHADVDA